MLCDVFTCTSYLKLWRPGCFSLYFRVGRENVVSYPCVCILLPRPRSTMAVWLSTETLKIKLKLWQLAFFLLVFQGRKGGDCKLPFYYRDPHQLWLFDHQHRLWNKIWSSDVQRSISLYFCRTEEVKLIRVVHDIPAHFRGY